VLREPIDWRIERSIIGSPTALTVPNDALGAEIRTPLRAFASTMMTGSAQATRGGRRAAFPLYPSDTYYLPMGFFDFVGSSRPMIGVGSAPAAEMIKRHTLGFVCATIDELASVLDNLTQNGRPADLPLQKRRLFELGCSRPNLQEVFDQAIASAG
jgi:hypothetical protein